MQIYEPFKTNCKLQIQNLLAKMRLKRSAQVIRVNAFKEKRNLLIRLDIVVRLRRKSKTFHSSYKLIFRGLFLLS